MVKRKSHIGIFLDKEMGVSLGGMSPMCDCSSIHLRKIFFLRSIASWEPGGVFYEKFQYEDTMPTRNGTKTVLVDGVVKPDSFFMTVDPTNRIHYFPEAD